LISGDDTSGGTSAVSQALILTPCSCAHFNDAR
jgi:hypothetical protein